MHSMTSWHRNVSALLALCEGNPSLTVGTKGQRCRTLVFLISHEQAVEKNKKQKTRWFVGDLRLHFVHMASLKCIIYIHNTRCEVALWETSYNPVRVDWELNIRKTRYIRLSQRPSRQETLSHHPCISSSMKFSRDQELKFPFLLWQKIYINIFWPHCSWALCFVISVTVCEKGIK